MKERDPACHSIVSAFINFKGFKSLQAHRAAHILWHYNRKDIALAIQSRCSELWGVDIHPAAVLGSGLMIDHVCLLKNHMQVVDCINFILCYSDRVLVL